MHCELQCNNPVRVEHQVKEVLIGDSLGRRMDMPCVGIIGKEIEVVPWNVMEQYGVLNQHNGCVLLTRSTGKKWIDRFFRKHV